MYKWSIACWLCDLHQIAYQTHLTQPCFKHDKHDGRPNEDAKDGNADLVGDVNQVIWWCEPGEPGDHLVGDVNQVEAPVVDVGVPKDQNTDYVHRSFCEISYLNMFSD